MNINPLIFRNYDIRGIVDTDLNVVNVEAIGRAYGTFLHRRRITQIVCGRDCRISSPEFQKVFMKGVSSTGVNIIDIGLCMTQMMYFGQYLFQTNGGAMITASHNPKNFNGFKLATGYSQTTGAEDLQEINKYIEEDSYVLSKIPGSYSTFDLKDYYFRDLLKRVHITRRFKIVIDTHHGTTGLFLPKILRDAGCDVIEINTRVDGEFPAGTPDPTDKKIMDELARLVLENGADLGFAFDGDGDRMGVVDSIGRILWNDVVIAIFAKDILQRFPKSRVVYNTLCSQVVRKVVESSGGVPIMWKTGHSFIKTKIAAENASFGGELSGHFFFADNFFGHDDGAFGALRILECLSEMNMSLSKLYESFPLYISSPEIKVGCPDDKKFALIENLSQRFKNDFPNAEFTDSSVIPGDDGVRADFEDGMVIFRYSQNGPYITVKFEAKDQTVFDARKKYVREMLHSYPDILWDNQLGVNLDFLV